MAVVLLNGMTIHERVVMCGSSRSVPEGQLLNGIRAQTVVQESTALAKESHSRNVHDSLFVKVGYELVAITENGFHDCAILLVRHLKGGVEIL
jgi:hypothetical protein